MQSSFISTVEIALRKPSQYSLSRNANKKFRTLKYGKRSSFITSKQYDLNLETALTLQKTAGNNINEGIVPRIKEFPIFTTLEF